MKPYLFFVFLLACTLLVARPYQENEKLYFNINYGVITAGEATLEVIPSHYNSIPCFMFKSTARTKPFFDSVFTVRDELKSTWDTQRQISLIFEKSSREGGYRGYNVQYAFPEKSTLLHRQYSFKKNKYTEHSFALQPNAQDPLSAFYLVRSMDLKPGDETTVMICVDKKDFPAPVKVLRRETLDSIFGPLPCLVLEPVLTNVGVFQSTGRIFIWVTDDQYKIPLKLQSKVSIGSFKAVLVNAENVPYAIKN